MTINLAAVAETSSKVSLWGKNVLKEMELCGTASVQTADVFRC